MHAWCAQAKLISTKGLKGEFVAQSVAGSSFLLKEGAEVAFVPPVLDAPRHARIESVQEQGIETCLVKFSEIDSADVAEPLVGCVCLIERACLENNGTCAGMDADENAGTETGALSVILAGEEELHGFEVIDENAGLVGCVLGVQSLPGHRLLEVERAQNALSEQNTQDVSRPHNSEPLLIPFVDEFIHAIDKQAKRIKVYVPSGLLDL